MKSKTHLWALVLLAGLPVGCNGESAPASASGGSAAGGSGPGAGGVAATGGTMSTGGIATGTGGGSGGTSGTGGTIGTGGITAQTGGALGTGGGSVRTGGATSVGGSSAAGGGFATGGTVGTGGSKATGGTVGTGGVGSGGTSAGNRDGAADVRPDAGGNVGGDGGADSASDAVALADVDPAKKITVWLAGDSTMQSCSSACPCGWGSQFQPLFNANATVVNSAAGGRSIQTWLYDPNVTTTMTGGECVVSPKTYSTRWQAMLDGMKAGDYLLVEFGINDGDSTCNRHVGTALFQSYLQYMAGEAKTRGAQAIFLTSTSAIECSGSAAQANRGFGAQTKAAGTAASVPVIDLTALSAAFYTSAGLCPNASDYTSTSSAVGKFFCDDHTHFEAAGAKEVAGVVAKALRNQGIGLAAYLK